MLEPPCTLLDTRVPQPGREESDYGVPSYIVAAAATLYRARNTASSPEVHVIDAAIMRLYLPGLRPR